MFPIRSLLMELFAFLLFDDKKVSFCLVVLIICFTFALNKQENE